MKKLFKFGLALLGLSMVIGGNNLSTQNKFDGLKVHNTYRAKNAQTVIDAGDSDAYSFTGSYTTLLSESECQTQGVPTGYTGSVLKMTGNTSGSTFIDFTKSNIEITSDLTISFRVYCAAAASGKKPEFRFQKKGGGWAMNGIGDFSGDGGYSLATVVNQWHTIIVSPSSFINSCSWSTFANEENPSILGAIDIMFRCVNTTDVLYFDSFTVGTPVTDDTDLLEFTNNEQFQIRDTFSGYPGTGIKEVKQGSTFAGIPSGYEGAVLKCEYASGNAGFVLDTTYSDIDLEAIKSIKVRLCVVGGSTSDEFRTNNITAWDQYGISDMTNWKEYSLTSTSIGWLRTNRMLWIGVRLKGASSTVVYFDSVKFEFDTTVKDFTNDEYKFTTLAGNAKILAGSELEAESLLAGYQDSVLKLNGNTSATIRLDFTDRKIPLGLVDNITFRILPTGQTSGKKPEFRLRPLNFEERGLNQWPIATSKGEFAGDGGLSMVPIMNTWYDLVIDTAKLDKNGWASLASEDDPSILGKIDLIYRTLDNASTLYFDYIHLNLKADDHVGPVLSGIPENMHIPAKSKFVVDAKAFDAQENREVPIETKWSPAQTFDAEGKIQNKGTYQVTFSASDYYGNKTEKTITVVVGEQDLTAPVINIPFDSISVLSGTVFKFDIDRYIVEEYAYTVEVTYSNGTFGRNNKLLAGTHTMTIVATDSSGNSSTKVITLVVTGDYVDDGEVIYEGQADYDAVEAFCVTYLKKNEIALDDNSATASCGTNYQNAKTAFNALTSEQKSIFLNDAEFANMLSRFQAWARANGEEIVIADSNISFVSMSGNMIARISMNSYLIYVVAGLLISFAAIAFVVSKRRYHK